MRFLFILLIALFPQVSLAAGGGDGGGSGGGSGGSGGGSGGNSGNDGGGKDDPPAQTQTSEDCTKAEVWDEKTESCVDSASNLLNDDQRYRAVRELAYYGRPADAMTVLHSMTEGKTARVMTYEGFLLRKTGQVEESIAAYEEALSIDPANILARSYYGQLLVEMDEIELAQAQLDEIRAHGGAGTWSERSLASAIATGVTYNF